MKNLVLLIGVGTAAFSQAAHAQNTLATYSQVESASAATTSYDYRYTRHVVGGGSGRGGGYHSRVIYTWDPFLDQTTSSVLPVTSGTPQQATASGSFYAPTYAATATAATTLTNTPAQAVLTVNYSGATTVTTALGAHQGVTVTAQPGDTFTFTVARRVRYPGHDHRRPQRRLPTRLVQRRAAGPVLRRHRRPGLAGHAPGPRDLLGHRWPVLLRRAGHAARNGHEPGYDVHRLGLHHDRHPDGSILRRRGRQRRRLRRLGRLKPQGRLRPAPRPAVPGREASFPAISVDFARPRML